MNALAESLKREIAANGPVTIARYMSEALLHPSLGYYTNANPIGSGGDFITAPEISQMFGEMLGLWLVSEWQTAGMPAQAALVELGPGHGTLMSDVLRAIGTVPACRKAMQPYLLEASPRLRSIQQSRLEGAGAQWIEGLHQLPNGPVFLLANEFFDALPIHQYVSTGNGWSERLIGLGHDGNFSFLQRPQSLPQDLFGQAPAGKIAEDCPAAKAVIAEIAGRIAAEGGTALIVDYGHAVSGFGDTLQAVRRHKFADVLENPGEQDLTAHVDFASLARDATKAGARAFGPVAQGTFLKALGIETRAARLKSKASDSQKADIDAALSRLTDASSMGNLFKVMALGRADRTSIPPGFSQ